MQEVIYKHKRYLKSDGKIKRVRIVKKYTSENHHWNRKRIILEDVDTGRRSDIALYCFKETYSIDIYDEF